MSDFDLPAYLGRIGLRARPPADAEGLAIVQRAHRLTIPFENLDIALGRGIGLDPDRVFDKLVTRRRGGYCFEQNQLFLRALHAIGFAARPLLARVWLLAGDVVPPRTHTLNLVTIDGQPWIADAGFGGSFTPPMPLAEGETQSPDGAVHRLFEHSERGWLLQRDGQDQYSFTLDPVFPSDLEMGNLWTSTAPGTRFTTLRVVSLALPNGLASVTERTYTRRNGDQHVTAELETEKAYRLRLDWVFGLKLSAEEVAALGLYDGA